MNKKYAVILLGLVLLSTSFSNALNASEAIGINDKIQMHIENTINSFKDVSSNEWYISKVAKLVALGGINGYEDGTFRPNNTITQGEFIKIVVAVFNGEEAPVATGQHWAMNYIKKAQELNYIDAEEYKAADLDKPITRYQMSKIVVRVASSRGESFKSDIQDYVYQIKDYQAVPAEYSSEVLKAFTQGIITGYTDGEFKGRQGLTRAEASTVIVRIFDKTERILPAQPITTSEIKKIEEAISNPSAIHDVFEIKHAQIFSYNPYESDLYINHGTTFFKVKGLNNLYIIQDNNIIRVMESYPNPDGFRYHVIPDGITLNEIDYFGNVEYRNDTMIIIPNPFKQR